jgi:beta-lactamase superfamily II metal-dependent hydrolase
MKNIRKYLPYILLLFLVLSAIYICYFLVGYRINSNILKVAFLDIGQGDSIYIEAPNGKQMLIDAGPSPVVLQKLSDVMPFGDRSIDLVLATHTDADHIGGFTSVLDKYKVDQIIENGADNTTKTYKNLEDKIKEQDIKKLIARRGMKIILDKEHNVYFDILFPNRDISNFESNDGSIVGKLVYGNESFMFTGDATKYTESLIMDNESKKTLHSQVLKLGHHGSKHSSSESWLKEVKPDIAIISAGLKNRYGHPHQEVLDLLSSLHIPYLGTYQHGTIVFKTDGLKLSY